MSHAVRPLRTRTALAFAIVLALVSAWPSGATVSAEAPPPEREAPVEAAGLSQRVVVRLRPDIAPGTARGLLGRLGVTEDKLLVHSGFYLITTDSPAAAEALISALRTSPLVDVVGNDRPVRALDVPNDPDYPRQWHLHSDGGGMNAETAWDLVPQGAAGVTVAVIDTGVAFETYTGSGPLGAKHFEPAPDLAGVPIVAPWNFIDGDTHANDENGHGTHVSSTIVEATNNGAGGAGVARGASLMPLKVLDYSGNGTGAHLVEAIYYAVDNGADVINMSLGFPDTGNPEPNGAVCGEIPGLHDALAYAAAQNVVVVAASGNDGGAVVSCPAAHPTVIAVGATDGAGAVTWYSNSGDALDITGPGGDPNVDLDGDGHPDGILQETYCFDWLSLFFSGNFNTFCSSYQSGTSMASPQVAGVAALLLAVDPQLTAPQVRYLLETTAVDRGDPGWDPAYGHGALDATGAISSLLATPPPDIAPEPYPIPTPYPRPEAPTDLTAQTVNSGSVRLDWTDNSSNESGFRIEYAPLDGGFRQAGLTTIHTYTVRNLDPTATYMFRVFAYDSQRIDSLPSNTASAVTTATPAAPSGLTASSATAWSARLSWTDNSDNETVFRVERSTDGSAFTFAGFLPRNGTSLTVTNLTPATDYWFRVQATDSATSSAFSNIATATTLPPPEAPSGLEVAGTTASSVSLHWVDNSVTEQGFKIEKSTDGGVTFSSAGIVPADSTAKTILLLSEGQTYNFRVRAYAGTTTSAPSNTVTVATNAAPVAPSDLAVVSATATTVALAWTDNARPGAGYRVERSLDGSTFSLAGVLSTNASGYTVMGLTPSTDYWFRVRAVEGSVYSAYSNVVQAQTTGGPQPPSNLTLTGTTATTLTVSWTDNSDNEQGFRIERSADEGATFVQVAIVLADRTSYRLTGLTPGTSYQVRVRAYTGTVMSAYSAVVTGTTESGPSAPGNLVASPRSATEVSLTWIDNSTNERFFSIERSTDGVDWTRAATLLANRTSYTVHSLDPVTTYRFRVIALVGSSASAPSNEAVATTYDVPAAPSNLTATVGIVNSVRLQWADNSAHESGFQIERSLDGNSWSRVAIVTANRNYWNNFGTKSGVTYHYRVRAYDGSIVSDFSNVASITLP